MGFARQEYWSGLPFTSPGDLPYLGIEYWGPALAGGFFTTEPPGKSFLFLYLCVIYTQVSSRVKIIYFHYYRLVWRMSGAAPVSWPAGSLIREEYTLITCIQSMECEPGGEMRTLLEGITEWRVKTERSLAGTYEEFMDILAAAPSFSQNPCKRGMHNWKTKTISFSKRVEAGSPPAVGCRHTAAPGQHLLWLLRHLLPQLHNLSSMGYFSPK